MVSEAYTRLMNGRYDRIRAASPQPDAVLDLFYDGDEWTASLEIRPSRVRDRWVTATGPTLERAVAALEKQLGLPPES